jgi:hypothetical protein
MVKRFNEALLRADGILQENEDIPNYVVLCNEEGEDYIVLESDCCHTLAKRDTKVSLTITRKTDHDSFQLDLKTIPIEEKYLLPDYSTFRLDQFINYFGIKDRVFRNYCLLKDTCKSFKIKVDFPKW